MVTIEWLHLLPKKKTTTVLLKKILKLFVNLSCFKHKNTDFPSTYCYEKAPLRKHFQLS